MKNKSEIKWYDWFNPFLWTMLMCSGIVIIIERAIKIVNIIINGDKK